MQEHASTHVGEGDEDHDGEGACEIALGPGLDGETLGGLGHGLVARDVGTDIVSWSYGTHGCFRRVYGVVGTEVAKVAQRTLRGHLRAQG